MVSLRALVVQLGLATSAATQQLQPNPCLRWSGQATLANAPPSGNIQSNRPTLWYYGGEARTTPDQSTQLWTNALVSLDLSSNWTTGAPAITLIQPDTTASNSTSNPPAVALGALWSNAAGTKLYQYGGQFSDSPSVPPAAQAVWEYTIGTGQWGMVQTGGDAVVRAAEGSTVVVPGGGTGNDMAYYFSGHLDDHTVQGWSSSIPRVYLSSLLTFDLGTFAFKNYTSYAPNASTSNSSTPEIANPIYRADGTLTFVPGLGTNGKGILVAIGGATSTQYIDNSVLDVFDIGAGGWTKQATLGDTITPRVNHCAVRGTVVGGMGHEIYVYGGQELGQSKRDSAIWILSIPSYTWKFVGDSLPTQPTGRAGHQCVLQGSQLVVVGGIVAETLVCDQPGIYIYDVSQSTWQTSFTANTTYTVPLLLNNGTTSTNSSSGSSSNGGGTGGGTPVGAIVGGVIGGLLGLALLLLLILFLWRKRRATEDSENEKVGNESDRTSSEQGLRGVSYDRSGSRPTSSILHQSPYNRRSLAGSGVLSAHASDDVEESTRGMEMSFGSQLVPQRALRVVNPEQDF